MGELLDASMDWLDRWWDPEVGLLWNPTGSFDELAQERSLHLVPQSAWYAAGLLFRAGAGDEAKAVRTIEALLATQYDEPGTPWHGTFARFLETPHPKPDAVMWVDYDPNWRQFIGTTFSVLLQEGRIADSSLASRVRAAIELAVAGEPPDRVAPSYSNIALMRAWLEVEHGVPGAEAYAARIVELFDAYGAFEEYNSATYYGIDLWALALWRDRSSSATLRADGARIEAALWRDIARWYHPTMRNLCGPWSRSYGMDLRTYASLLAVWMWPALGREATPFPSLDGPIEHSHDLSHAPLADHLGPAIPDDARAALLTFSGEHTVEQRITSTRVATGWLADRVMCGGEHGDLTASARGQFHPATVHWLLPDGDVGWIRLVHYAPARATASPGRLDIELSPSAKRGPVAPELWISGADDADLDGPDWSLPGLHLGLGSVSTPLRREAAQTWRVVRFPVGTDRLTLELEAT
jgi:hypothetical protein